MKHLIKLVGVALFLFIAAEAAIAGPVESWVNKVKWIDVGDKSISKVETIDYIEKASVYLEKGVSSPTFYYYRGRLGSILLGHYIRGLMAEGKPYFLSAPENQALIKEYQSYYRKALNLDDNPDAPEHLTATMLSSMADDVLAAPDIKERAYKKVIALARAGKADSDYEPYEYETYQFLLESYSAQKNPDKYLATLNEMIDRFGSTEELDGYKRHVEEVIAKRDNAAAATVEDTYAQAEPYAEPIEEVAAEPQAVEPYAEPIEVGETSKPAPVAKVAKPKLEPQADTQESNVMLWLLGGVVLLGLIWFAFRRRKHSA